MRLVYVCLALLSALALSACVSEDDLPEDLIHELEAHGSITFPANEISLDEQGVIRTSSNLNVLGTILLGIALVTFGATLSMLKEHRLNDTMRELKRLDALRGVRPSPPPQASTRWKDVALVLFAGLSLLLCLLIFGDLKMTFDPRSPHIAYERHALFGLFVYTRELPPRPESHFQCAAAPYGSIGYSIYVVGVDQRPIEGTMALNLLAYMNESMLERCRQTAEALNRATFPAGR